MTTEEQNQQVSSMPFWAVFGAGLALLIYIYFDGLQLMVGWWSRDEYSHGYMIPLVAAFLVWQRQWLVAELSKGGSWLGLPVVIFGLFLFYLGELSSIYTVIQYGFLVALFGLVMAFVGLRAWWAVWVALVYLIFMIPLPNFLYNNLSSQLQLISSALGVAVIRLFDISVYLEGNVIDLGVYKLQVVEACSGLRYLFPLMSFGFLISAIYKGPWWQKVILFLSTIPITVLMNSFRIGVIGVTVEYWGIEMAEGFLHDFEGWVIFMSCLAILVLEIWIFHKMSQDEGSLWDKLDLDLPENLVKFSSFNYSMGNQKPLILSLVAIAAAAISVPMLDARQEPIFDRKQFVEFPLTKDEWKGREGTISAEVLKELELTDYIKADYVNGSSITPLNFYVAYYNSQRKGASIHSPRSCIPGGGWRLTGLQQFNVPGVTNREGMPLEVNKVTISKGEVSQLVYYWFEQRERNITNEYLAKWYIFVDALFRNRTDGALVRVVGQVPNPESKQQVEENMIEFIQDFYPELKQYLPAAD